MANLNTKLVFLDFDGVLHPGHADPNERFIHVTALEHTIARYDCGIVISSSWRFHHSRRRLDRCLPPSLRRRLEGCTGPAEMGQHARYHEIRVWLDADGPRDWRALDDSVFEFPRNCPRLIACNGANGLGPRELIALQVWLSGPVIKEDEDQ